MYWDLASLHLPSLPEDLKKLAVISGVGIRWDGIPAIIIVNQLGSVAWGTGIHVLAFCVLIFTTQMGFVMILLATQSCGA